MKIALIDRTIEGSTARRELVIYEFPEGKDKLVVGRGKYCGIRLPKDGHRNEKIDSLALTVSRKHCLIYEKDGQVGIVDVDSRHGTYLNGVEIPKKKGVLLKDGTKVRLGNYELEVRIGDEPLQLRIEEGE